MLRSRADARAHLGELVDRVEAGDSIDILGAANRSPAHRSNKVSQADRRGAAQALTAKMPLQAESGADLVRSMRDGDRC